jgi:hypothetical protein
LGDRCKNIFGSALSTWQGPLFGHQSALALVRVDTDAPGLLRLAAYAVASRTVLVTAQQPWPDAEATVQYQRAQALAVAGKLPDVEQLLHAAPGSGSTEPAAALCSTQTG